METQLKGHISQETAYLVNDYPYGFTTRTQIRYWIESDGKIGSKSKGFRAVSQTLNPKTNRWNAPKKSTYSDLMAMYLDENNHVKFHHVSFSYGDASQLNGFEFEGDRAKYGRLIFATKVKMHELTEGKNIYDVPNPREILKQAQVLASQDLGYGLADLK